MTTGDSGSAAIHAFQIWYDAASRSALDPDFEPLHNANDRPDWYEYWPIRSYLASHTLDEAAFYGFFSPQFGAKTGLSGRQVLDFAASHPDVDVVTFSPWPCHVAVFFNVFEQGEAFFPGLGDLAVRFLQELDPGIRPDICNDSHNTVYCNFFLAKPRFWHAWNRILSRCFDLAEAAGSDLGRALVRPVSYTKDTGETKPSDMKIMVMERVPSVMLASGDFRVARYDPSKIPVSYPFRLKRAEISELDALKTAYRVQGDQEALHRFVALRDRVMSEVGN